MDTKLNKSDAIKTAKTNCAKDKEKPTTISKPITHLYGNDKFSNKIEKSCSLRSLTVLYLHNNSITKIENLNSAINLKHLYLQRNNIEKLENLQNLKSLEKLYLGYNAISVVEGLEELNNLKELHLERQSLDGDPLCFDWRSIAAISNSLEVLITFGNNITTLKSLHSLKFLRILNAGHNNLSDIRDICDAIYNWYHLREATFIGNPIDKLRQYRENIISSSHKLAILDNNDINETTRSFIKSFEREKLNKSSKPSINIPEWTKSYGSLGLQKAVCESLLKNSKPCFDNSTIQSNAKDIYLPWKALPRSKNKIGKFTITSQK